MNRIKGVFIGLKRNLAMVFATLILIFLTLFILGFALIVTINTQDMSVRVLQSLKVHVFLEEDVNDGEIANVVSQISKLDGVESYELSDKEEQLDKVTSQFGEEGTQIKDYFGGEKNPLSDVINVNAYEGTDLEVLKLNIEAIEHVQSADYGQEYGADKLIASMHKISFFAILSSLIFAIITMFLIINTIKLTINSRRKEIEIMRLVGATKWYITFPFAFEGAFLGLIGGTLSFLVLYFLYFKLVESVMFDVLTPAGVMLIPLILGQIVFGMVIGLIGSTIAIRNYLRV